MSFLGLRRSANAPSVQNRIAPRLCSRALLRKYDEKPSIVMTYGAFGKARWPGNRPGRRQTGQKKAQAFAGPG
jgi:hypothetical protein